MFLSKIGKVRDLLINPIYRKVFVAKWLCRFLSKLYPNVKYLGLEDGDTKTYLFLRDSVITPYSIATGNFQKSDVLSIIKLSDKLGYKLGGCFLDVGANIGTSTLYALQSGRFSRGLAIEPSPTNLELLKLNLSANNLEKQVTVFNGAVSEKEGVLTLTISTENCGDHRISFDEHSKSRETQKVKVSTLDHLVMESNLTPADVSFVWIDTQGHEGFVLSGAASLLSAGIPFCIEFWPDGLKEAGCFDKLIAILQQNFGYFIDMADMNFTQHPIREIAQFSEQFVDTNKHTDVFLIPGGCSL